MVFLRVLCVRLWVVGSSFGALNKYHMMSRPNFGRKEILLSLPSMTTNFSVECQCTFI